MDQQTLKTIITDPNGTQTLVEQADHLGKSLKESNLSTNQIRALYGEVRQIEGMWSMDEAQRKRAYRRLILLKPKMAYRARAERGMAVRDLVAVLTPALDLVVNEKSEIMRDAYFHNFVEFFEAILAYHKAYGGS